MMGKRKVPHEPRRYEWLQVSLRWLVHNCSISAALARAAMTTTLGAQPCHALESINCRRASLPRGLPGWLAARCVRHAE